MGQPFEAPKHWGLWGQPDGPNTDMEYFGDCVDLDDISAPGRDIGEISRCWKADGSGWEIRGSTETPPDPITTSVTLEIEAVAHELEKIAEKGCEFPLYINGALCAPLDVFTNTARSFLFEAARTGEEGLTMLVKKEEQGFSQQTFALSMWPPILRARALTGGRQQIAEYSALNDIHFGNVPRCAGYCGSALDTCDYGIAVADSPAGSPAEFGNVWYTTDGGTTWTATAADPFAAGEDVISGVIFPIAANTYRLLVAREADAANPMEVAYSDDWGANWTLVVVGTVNNLGANREGALFMLDPYHIWLCLDTGYIYFSSDFGVSFSLQAGGAGAPTANDLNEIWFSDANNGMAVGDSDTVLVTTDGGSSWTLATATGGGNNLLCCSENGGGDIWWAGDSGGDLYYSTDHGTTWTQREFTGDGVGDVTDVEFVNTLVGFLLHDNATPVGSVYRTRNGGRDWELFTDVSNSGLNSLHACGINLTYAAGEVYQPGLGGTAVVLRYAD